MGYIDWGRNKNWFKKNNNNDFDSDESCPFLHPFSADLKAGRVVAGGAFVGSSVE